MCPQSLLLPQAHGGPRQAAQQHLLGPHCSDPHPHHTHQAVLPCPVWSTGETGLWRAKADSGYSLGHQASGCLWTTPRALAIRGEQHCSKRGVTSKAIQSCFCYRLVTKTGRCFDNKNPSTATLRFSVVSPSRVQQNHGTKSGWLTHTHSPL